MISASSCIIDIECDLVNNDNVGILLQRLGEHADDPIRCCICGRYFGVSETYSNEDIHAAHRALTLGPLGSLEPSAYKADTLPFH